MAEQYLAAFAVDDLAKIVGSQDDGLVRAALRRIGALDEAGVLLRATDAAEVEPALREIVSGRLDPGRSGGYTWLLELLAPVVGTPVGAMVLPGRDWHRLRKIFRRWELTLLADVWHRPWPFPWADPALAPAHPWPFPMLAARSHLDSLARELAGFDIARVDEDGDRLPNGDDDVEEVAELVGVRVPKWVAAAHGRDLLIIRDGGQ